MADTGRDVLTLLDVSQRLQRDRRTQAEVLARLLAAGYGVNDLARITGLSAASVSRFKNGKQRSVSTRG